MQEQHYTYARFWKCALQVNSYSYGSQYRGMEPILDPQSYAEKLRDICLAEDIKVVGFADHGNVADAEMARIILKEAGVIVFPGFEVATTEKVHWVCLFPEDTDERQLERYLGKLHLTDPRNGIRPSDLGGQQMLMEVETLGGTCFAAHVTSDNGLLKKRLNNLWTDARLRIAQIPGKVDHLPEPYKAIARNKNADYRRDRAMALINAGDVITPEDLCDPRKSTFIKMTPPALHHS